VQIDSTPIDVMVLLESGMPVRADLTIAVDVATRTICAAVLRPVGTKAVDAALLLARMLVPEPMRPGWSAALRMSASRLPHARLLDIDTRMELAVARPVIVPDTIAVANWLTGTVPAIRLGGDLGHECVREDNHPSATKHCSRTDDWPSPSG
jgi:putative transposase